jgi:acyl carrier protein
MAELGDRLVRCFSSVFPALTHEEIQTAEIASLIDADSLASVTLLAVINEEFGVQMDLEGLLELENFEKIERYLRGKDGPGTLPNEYMTK